MTNLEEDELLDQIQSMPLYQHYDNNKHSFEFCNIHDDYVETLKQYFCKNCMQYLCDECYENRRKHECILVEEDVL